MGHMSKFWGASSRQLPRNPEARGWGMERSGWVLITSRPSVGSQDWWWVQLGEEPRVPVFCLGYAETAASPGNGTYRRSQSTCGGSSSEVREGEGAWVL